MTYEPPAGGVNAGASLGDDLAPSLALPSADEAGEGVIFLRDIIEASRRPPRIRTRKHGGDFPPKIRSKVINCLRTAGGDLVRTSDLVEYVYGDDPDGGPETASHCLRVFIHHLRKAGWPIERVGYQGYRYAWTQHEVAA